VAVVAEQPGSYVRSWFGLVRPRLLVEICPPFDAAFRVALVDRHRMLLQVIDRALVYQGWGCPHVGALQAGRGRYCFLKRVGHRVHLGLCCEPAPGDGCATLLGVSCAAGTNVSVCACACTMRSRLCVCRFRCGEAG
jgi:hypothetical protein